MSLLAMFFGFASIAMLVGAATLEHKELEEKYRALRADYDESVRIMCNFLGYARTGKSASALAKELCETKGKNNGT